MALFDFFKETNGEAKSVAETEEQTAETGQQTATDNDALYKKINVIIEEVRPYLQADGGDVELLKVEDAVAYVRLVGACVGCPSSMMTLKAGVENRIREAVPEIEAVEMV